MEPSEITKVLARASDLQAKLDVAIRRASQAEQAAVFTSSAVHDDGDDEDCNYDNGFDDEDDHNQGFQRPLPDLHKLRAIRQALVDLEHQLDILQALQKQQKLERENVLVKLEERRKALIRRLREYNGTEWEIIQDAHAFVGVPVQRKDDLVLPPYQEPVDDILTSEDHAKYGGLSKRSNRQSSSRRASLASRPDDEIVQDAGIETGGNKNVTGNTQPRNKSGFKAFLAHLVSTKVALVVTSVVTLFALSQMEPHLRKTSAQGIPRAQPPKGNSEGKPRPALPSDTVIVKHKVCPPGKVLLVEDGIPKCFVKERIEAPFDEVIKQPNASYGFG